MHNNKVFLISSSKSSSLGGMPVTLRITPQSSRSVSFDWDNLVEARIPSVAPFQIRVRVNSKNVYQFMVDEGSSASIISSSLGKLWVLQSCWQVMVCY